ncbi:DUF402 domain-containing protein [Kyrpidia spormannii]|uniref:DUF402 domain-containing protein n=1 Tax=Kyrpidia spormannii TaxID=2055160 RepID=A0A6F9EEL5_9BACL|nr:DUF402 domain-containing protein [Kyrpidia spormannii]CAB3395319.1 conserved protein of unknown function [Kyrpidia spormannii]
MMRRSWAEYAGPRGAKDGVVGDVPEVAPYGRVCLESVKRGDSPGTWKAHRRWPEAQWLQGRSPVLWFAPGTPVVEGNGRRWSSPYPVICWLWEDKWFHVMALCREDGTGYYCNIASPPVWLPERKTLRVMDLELDVRIEPRGRPKVVDRDEFEMAVRRGRITRIEAAAAERAVEELLGWIKDRTGPFDPGEVIRWRRVGEGQVPE